MQVLKINMLISMVLFIGTSLSQTGPGGVGTNDGTSSLKLWLDANSGTYQDTLKKQTTFDFNRVKLWKDLSGSSNDVRAISDTNTPLFMKSVSVLNNQNALRFFKDQDTTLRRTFLVSKSFAKTNDITIYCVFHALTNAAGNNVTPYEAKNYNPNMWYSGSGLVDGGAPGMVNDVSLALCDTSIAAGVGDSTTKTDYCIKQPASINKSYFAVLQKEAWNGKLSLNHNYSLATNYQAGPQPINNGDNYYIGSTSDVYSGKTNPFFDGYIASVLVYNRILNKTEKMIVENYLSAKYNIPLLVNDLYNFDDPQFDNYDFELIGIGKSAEDGSQQLTAKGEGIIEINAVGGVNSGDFLFIANNGKTMDSILTDLPDGIQSRVDRKWKCKKIGSSQKIDLLVDSKELSFIDSQNVVLLIDTDNDGNFSDEIMGGGILPLSDVTNTGRFLFREINFKSGNTFTFAKLKNKPTCVTNCEDYFTPNGDGNSDVILISATGKSSIFDRSGNLVKSLQTPSYWDGTNESGEPVTPGIYFVMLNNDVYKTITLVK